MVLIDFTDEEIRHIFQHYPTPRHHEQIWSKLMRAMVPKQEASIWNLDKDEFDERLRKASKIVGMNLMNNMLPQAYPPTYNEQISSIEWRLEDFVRRINDFADRIGKLEKAVVDLKIYGKKWTDK